MKWAILLALSSSIEALKTTIDAIVTPDDCVKEKPAPCKAAALDNYNKFAPCIAALEETTACRSVSWYFQLIEPWNMCTSHKNADGEAPTADENKSRKLQHTGETPFGTSKLPIIDGATEVKIMDSSDLGVNQDCAGGFVGISKNPGLDVVAACQEDDFQITAPIVGRQDGGYLDGNITVPEGGRVLVVIKDEAKCTSLASAGTALSVLATSALTGTGSDAAAPLFLSFFAVALYAFIL